MTLRSTILAVAAVAASLSAAPASAQTLESIQVSYGDLNLHSAAGRTALDGRIAAAARRLCGTYPAFELEWSQVSRACQADVIASTAGQRDAVVAGESFAALVVSRAAS